MNLDVQVQGVGRILDVDFTRGVGGFENLTIFIDVVSSLRKLLGKGKKVKRRDKALVEN